MDNLEASADLVRTEALTESMAALRRQFGEFGRVQARQSRSLDVLRHQIISDDGLLVGLNKEMIALKDNVTVLEVKVYELERKVDKLVVKVDKIDAKVDAVEVKVDKLQIGIEEILDRLPARAA